jgi:hypothetical protein
MAETAFDRTERGLGSTDFSVADIVAKTRGNPQQIMQLVMGGQINLTQGLLAKRLADSVVAEQQKAAMPTTTVLQDAFPQAAPPVQAPAAPPMQAPPGMGMGMGMGMGPGAPSMPSPMPPQQQMQAPPGMAEGGLAQLDFPAPDYAGGGMVSFAAGDPVPAPEEEEEPEMLYGLPASYFETPELDVAGARQEVANLLPQANTANEAYRALLGEVEDPAKLRQRAELQGLFGSLANVRPGMNPLEALVQGFSSTGASMQASEERNRERALQRAEGLMNLENAQNDRERDLYNASVALAEARRSGADAATLRRLEAAKEQAQREFDATQAELDRQADMARTLVQEGGATSRARMSAGRSAGDAAARPMGQTAAGDAMARAERQIEAAEAALVTAVERRDLAGAQRARETIATARQMYNAGARALGFGDSIPRSARQVLGIRGRVSDLPEDDPVREYLRSLPAPTARRDSGNRVVNFEDAFADRN